MTQDSNHELLKSILIGILAFIALICWLEFQPKLPDQTPEEKIGKKVLEGFDDPSKMTELEFVAVDSITGKLNRLSLLRDGSQWKLPSASGFPADNSERLAKVVAPLLQLTVLDVVDETSKKSNEAKAMNLLRECGLLSPENYEFEAPLNGSGDDSKTGASEKNLAIGVALEVKIKLESGEFYDLLVGNRVPGSASTRDDRFIRFPNEEVVFTSDFVGNSIQETTSAELYEYPERVSFHPLDWADCDLLRISRWDILYLTTRDTISRTETNKREVALAPILATFKQNPENSSSRIWTLVQKSTWGQEGKWLEDENVNEESANSEALNLKTDALVKLNIADVRRKPDALVALFRSSDVGSSLVNYEKPLAEFGFSFESQDPLHPEKIEPSLTGDGGALEIVTKTGIKINLVFGKNFDDLRAVLAYASFSKDALAEATEDEAEIEFLEQESRRKAELKNKRFADWFYMIRESDYQKLRLNPEEVLE